MEIGSQFAVHSAHQLSGLHRPQAAREVAATPFPIPRDEVSLSAAGKMAASQETTNVSDVRFDLVNRIRAEIAAGTYDTPDKMDVAFERMFASMKS